MSKSCIKSANDARSMSVQLQSIGVSDSLASELKTYSAFMEELYSATQPLTKDQVEQQQQQQ